MVTSSTRFDHKQANKIGPLATDMNVDVTFEGDNTVLMQQARNEEEKPWAGPGFRRRSLGRGQGY